MRPGAPVQSEAENVRRWRRVLAAAATARLGTLAAVVVAAATAVLTLRGLPSFTIWPALVGLLPWTLGKYVLCPLRWRCCSAGAAWRWPGAAEPARR
jgi:hypothetical protein